MGKVKEYRVVGGSHVQDGLTYPRGSIIKTDVNLVKLFGKKFERVLPPDEDEERDTAKPAAIPTALSKKKEAEAKNEAAKEDDDTEKEKVNPNDVTKDFPTASKIFLVVHKAKAKNRFNLFDPEDMDKSLNKAPLGVTGINKLLESYSQGG